MTPQRNWFTEKNSDLPKDQISVISTLLQIFKI